MYVSVLKKIISMSTGGVKSPLLVCSVAIIFLAGNASCVDIAGKITFVTGDAVCRRPGVAEVRTLKSGDPVQVADLLETGKSGKIQVLLTAGTVITLMPGSAIRISQYSFDRDKSRMSAAASLKQGTARFILYKELKGGSSLNIETDQALIQTSRADFVVTASGQHTELFTLAGSVGVRNSSNLVVGDVRVGENQSVIVQAKTPPTSPSVIPLPQRRKFNKDARQF